MATQTKPQTAADLKPPITVQQWGKLEGPPYYELVNGHLVEKPDVALWHDIFLFAFAGLLQPFVQRNQLGCITGSTSKVKISDFHGRQPDLFFVSNNQLHLIGLNLFKGVPPLVIEILSPSNEKTDRVDKFREYAELGAGQYWIVDCPNRQIEVYVLSSDESGNREYQLDEIAKDDEVFHPSLFPGLEITLGQIWPTDFIDRTDD